MSQETKYLIIMTRKFTIHGFIWKMALNIIPWHCQQLLGIEIKGREQTEHCRRELYISSLEFLLLFGTRSTKKTLNNDLNVIRYAWISFTTYRRVLKIDCDLSVINNSHDLTSPNPIMNFNAAARRKFAFSKNVFCMTLIMSKSLYERY